MISCHSVARLADVSVYNRHSILDMVLVIRSVRFTIRSKPVRLAGFSIWDIDSANAS